MKWHPYNYQCLLSLILPHSGLQDDNFAKNTYKMLIIYCLIGKFVAYRPTILFYTGYLPSIFVKMEDISNKHDNNQLYVR